MPRPEIERQTMSMRQEWYDSLNDENPALVRTALKHVTKRVKLNKRDENYYANQRKKFFKRMASLETPKKKEFLLEHFNTGKALLQEPDEKSLEKLRKAAAYIGLAHEKRSLHSKPPNTVRPLDHTHGVDAIALVGFIENRRKEKEEQAAPKQG